MTGGQVGRVVWPDTQDQEPPCCHRYRSAVWLLGRHEQLAGLAARIPGVISADADGPDIDLDALADAITGSDADGQAWADYERRSPAPDDDAGYHRWVAAGPQPGPGVAAFVVMSSGEQARLRLLAMFATDRVPVTVSDLACLDDDGTRLLTDWCRAVQAQ